MIFRDGFDMDFFRSSKQRELAKKLISELPIGNLMDQLAARRIKKIFIIPRFQTKYNWVHVLGELCRKKDKFYILLPRDQKIKDLDARITEHLLTVGHEIGHTYFFCLVKIQNQNTGEWTGKLVRQYVSCGDINQRIYFSSFEEKFCEEFAKQWVTSCDNQRELREALQIALTLCREKKSQTVVDVGLDDLDLTALLDETPRPMPKLTPEEEAELPF